ncbi:hypothetical protein D3C72_1726290 [compost metagenome]
MRRARKGDGIHLSLNNLFQKQRKALLLGREMLVGKNLLDGGSRFLQPGVQPRRGIAVKLQHSSGASEIISLKASDET